MSESGITPWPETLPVFLSDWKRKNLPQNEATEMESGRVRRRRIHPDALKLLEVAWNFTQDEFEAFRDFFNNDLENGTLPFSVTTYELVPPNGEEFRNIDWVLYFFGPYSYQRSDNLFTVVATLAVEDSDDVVDGESRSRDPADNPLSPAALPEAEVVYSECREEFTVTQRKMGNGVYALVIGNSDKGPWENHIYFALQTDEEFRHRVKSITVNNDYLGEWWFAVMRICDQSGFYETLVTKPFKPQISEVIPPIVFIQDLTDIDLVRPLGYYPLSDYKTAYYGVVQPISALEDPKVWDSYVYFRVSSKLAGEWRSRNGTPFQFRPVHLPDEFEARPYNQVVIIGHPGAQHRWTNNLSDPTIDVVNRRWGEIEDFGASLDSNQMVLKCRSFVERSDGSICRSPLVTVLVDKGVEITPYIQIFGSGFAGSAYCDLLKWVPVYRHNGSICHWGKVGSGISCDGQPVLEPCPDSDQSSTENAELDEAEIIPANNDPEINVSASGYTETGRGATLSFTTEHRTTGFSGGFYNLGLSVSEWLQADCKYLLTSDSHVGQIPWRAYNIWAYAYDSLGFRHDTEIANPNFNVNGSDLRSFEEVLNGFFTIFRAAPVSYLDRVHITFSLLPKTNPYITYWSGIIAGFLGAIGSRDPYTAPPPGATNPPVGGNGGLDQTLFFDDFESYPTVDANELTMTFGVGWDDQWYINDIGRFYGIDDFEIYDAGEIDPSYAGGVLEDEFAVDDDGVLYWMNSGNGWSGEWKFSDFDASLSGYDQFDEYGEGEVDVANSGMNLGSGFQAVDDGFSSGQDVWHFSRPDTSAGDDFENKDTSDLESTADIGFPDFWYIQDYSTDGDSFENKTTGTISSVSDSGFSDFWSVTNYSYAGVASPLDITGCQLWLDASDLSTLYTDSALTTPVAADGDPVGGWKDKSGNNFHGTQATAGKRPLYKTARFFGTAKTILFDGTDDYLDHGASSLGLFKNLTGATVVAVVKKTTGTGAMYFFAATTPTSTVRVGLIFNQTTAQQITAGGRIRDADGFAGRESTGLAAATPYNVHARYDYNATGNLGMRINGADNPSSAAWQLAGTTDNTNGSRVLTGAFADLNQNFNGELAELIVYNKLLSTTERDNIEGYLRTKYDLY